MLVGGAVHESRSELAELRQVVAQAAAAQQAQQHAHRGRQQLVPSSVLVLRRHSKALSLAGLSARQARGEPSHALPCHVVLWCGVHSQPVLKTGTPLFSLFTKLSSFLFEIQIPTTL